MNHSGSRSWIKNYRIAHRFSTVSSYLLVAGMMFCLGIVFSELIRHLYREYLPAYLSWLCFTASLAGMYVDHLARDRAKLSGVRDVFLINLSEWVILLLLIKGVLYFVRGFDQLKLDVIAMKTNPFPVLLLDGQFIIYGFVVLGCWVVSKSFARDLHNLSVNVAELAWDIRQIVEVSRNDARQAIQSRFFSIGLVLIFLTLTSRIPILQTSNRYSEGEGSYSLVGLLLFFSFGFILLSQTQFSLLRGKWLMEKAWIPDDIGKTWLVYGLIFFVGLGIISVSLPTGYSLGLLDTIKYLVYFITQLLYLLYGLVLFIVAWLFRPLLQSMPNSGEQELNKIIPTSVPPPLPEINPVDPAGSALPWAAVVSSILLWGLLIAVLLYALFYAIRKHSDLWESISRISIWEWVKKLLGFLFQAFGDLGRKANVVYEAAVRRFKIASIPVKLGSKQFSIFPRKLAPGEKVRYYFLALLRKCEDRGIPRLSHQTPYQYINFLNERVDSLEPELHELTEMFIEARYSKHLISTDQSSSARSLWRRLTRKLPKEE